MPLSELYRMAKGKLDSSEDKSPTCPTDPSLVPENDFVELVWENGQVLMQGQSSRARNGPACNSLPWHILPFHSPQSRDKDMGNGSSSKFGKVGTMDSDLNEFPGSVPSGEMRLGPDDDMVNWLNYPSDESLQHGYCSDFLPELSGVTVSEFSNQNNFASIDKRSSGNQTSSDSNTGFLHSGVSLGQDNVPKVSSAGGGRHRATTSQLFSSSSQQCQTSFQFLRSEVSANMGNIASGSTHQAGSRDSSWVPISAGGFAGIEMQKRYPISPNNNSRLMNFSHFSRPAALVKANLKNISAMAASGVPSGERMARKDKEAAASSSNLVDSTLVDSSSGLRKESSSHIRPIMVPSNVNEKQLDAKPLEEPLAAKQSEAIPQEDVLINYKNQNQMLGESATRGLSDGEKNMEPVVAASSVSSGNSVERASDDPTHNLKRKCGDIEEPECPSEDAEEESVGAKKAARGLGSKRSRAAEVHNLSERRRRDRINEKMRALQELIPNCNKVDKASMLDEAIEYLKALQLQLQIMSMGSGLYMPAMMLPTGMQHMHAAHMAHFSPMGVAMGMGCGLGMPDMTGGSSGFPMIQVPSLQGAHFPGAPIAGSTAMQGIAGSNIQLFGIPGQQLPMSMPRAPFIPLSGGPIMKSAMGVNAYGLVGTMENLEPTVASSSKDPMQSINSQVIQNTGANISMNQTSRQGQATSEGFEQSALVQNNGEASDINGS